MYFQCLLILLLFISTTYGYEDCANKPGNVIFESVKVDECDVNKRRCHVKRGTEVKIVITFSSNANFDSAKANPYFIKDGKHISIKLDNYDACKNCGITCPIKKNESYTYQKLVSIYKMRGEKDIRWQFEDNGKNELFCVMIPLKSSDD